MFGLYNHFGYLLFQSDSFAEEQVLRIKVLHNKAEWFDILFSDSLVEHCTRLETERTRHVGAKRRVRYLALRLLHNNQQLVMEQPITSCCSVMGYAL